MRVTPLDPSLRIAGSALSAMLWAVGCAPSPSARSAADESAPPTAESAGYAAPPTLVSAVRSGTETAVAGRASPSAVVRIAAPDGWSVRTSAGRDGVWRARLPAAAPRMFALSAEEGARVVRAEGALVSLPPPGPPALIARAGYAVLVPPARVAGPQIAAVDFDSVGSAAIGGVAPPNVRVQLAVDGQPADVDMTDAGGRFALAGPRNRPLAPGRHSFTVAAPQAASSPAADTVTVDLAPPPPLAGAMRATRVAEGWRLDWALPGGGVQSTLALDRVGSRAP